MTKRTVAIVAGMVAVAGVSASASIGWRYSGDHRPRASAAWAIQADSPGALARHADAIFIGRAGGSQYSRTACSDGGEDCLDFDRTTFEVLRGFKGVRRGQSLQVERLSLDVVDFDGGRFAEGRDYLLFVKAGEGGSYYQINDESRFDVVAGRLRAAAGQNGAAAALHGRSISEAVGAMTAR